MNCSQLLDFAWPSSVVENSANNIIFCLWCFPESIPLNLFVYSEEKIYLGLCIYSICIGGSLRAYFLFLGKLFSNKKYFTTCQKNDTEKPKMSIGPDGVRWSKFSYRIILISVHMSYVQNINCTSFPYDSYYFVSTFNRFVYKPFYPFSSLHLPGWALQWVGVLLLWSCWDGDSDGMPGQSSSSNSSSSVNVPRWVRNQAKQLSLLQLPTMQIHITSATILNLKTQRLLVGAESIACWCFLPLFFSTFYLPPK